MKRWTPHRARALFRHHGPRSLIFRRRVAMVGGAISIGLVALLFASLADRANRAFLLFYNANPYWPLLLTPLGFVAVVWITRRFAPDARGSGIPQVIAASSDPQGGARSLISVRTAVIKAALTLASLLCGSSTGREGPTVQLAAAMMAVWHKAMRVEMRASMIIAGGAAGVAAAFNTPLAGIAFAIEELAAAYEQRMALLVMTAILISGAVASGLAGDYLYFGAIGASMNVRAAVIVAPVAGVLGGLSGGLFSKLVLGVATSSSVAMTKVRSHPFWFALGCGVVVAVLGVSTGMTWGPGYAQAHAMIVGVNAPFWFGFAKFAVTAATAIAGLPGGIFAPSLATGAGFGNMLRWCFPSDPESAVVLLGMVAYFTGVVRAPLTAVFILSETTGSRALMLPMMAAALIADRTSQAICREKLYHGLSRTFSTRASEA
ncbi:chloride channel protein [Sphingomonas koreensis]|nr:chloride channel protein [Sphingomonas koreensis]